MALRKMLVGKFLAAVISLPAGVFNPYSGVKTSILILDRAVAKESQHVAFFKIENDGFALGAQRKAVKGSQLAQVKAELGAWLRDARAGGGEVLESSLGSSVERAKLSDDGGYNLSGERYGEIEKRQAAFLLVRLEDVVEILKRRPITKSDRIAGRYPYYGATGELDRVAGFIFDEPLVLPGEDGAKWEAGEKSAFAISGKTWVNNHAHVMRPKRERLLDKFLIELLNEADLMPFVSGVTVPKLNQQNLRCIEIPLPPVEVQREIVAEIEAYQLVIDDARAVLANYHPHTPVDPEWPVAAMGEICTTITDGDHQPPPKADEGVPFITISNLDEMQGVNFAKTYFVLRKYYDALKDTRRPVRGDLLYSVTGSYGVVVPVVGEREFCFQRHIALLRPSEKVMANYLLHFLRSPAGKQQGDAAATGVAQKTVSVTALREFKVPLPTLDVQRAIVAEIEAEQALVNGNRDLITRLEKKIATAIARVWGEAKSERAV